MSEDQEHPYGKPITLMKFSDTGKVEVNYEDLEEMFNNEEIHDRKIVILSLIGAFRGGKSYFLNYCLRFLYAHYSSINDPKIDDGEFLFEKNKNWMGSSDEPLKGFSWRSGTKRDTIGIIMWSDVFLHTIDKTGEKVAIFVMDTQGLFDKHSSQNDNSRIFSISNLISSIQILNLANRIQEDQLQYLQLTTEFATFAMANKTNDEKKSFQNLLFLIRDWNNPDDYNYGIKDGYSYLEEVLIIKPNQKPELQLVREKISNCFDDIACCLLPNPGKGVSRGQGYNGCWSKMDEDFKDELQKIIEILLLPNNLIVKKINSVDVNGRQLKQYIKEYFELFQSDKIPEASTLHEMTVVRFMHDLIEKCLDDYIFTIYGNEEIITEENITLVHEKCKEKALELFDNEKKMGNAGHSTKFKAILQKDIDEYFVHYRDKKERNLEKIRLARQRYEATINTDLKRKEEIERNIEKIKNQLTELDQKRRDNQFLTDIYDDQEENLKSRLACDEEELQKIKEKLKKDERFKMLLLAIVTGLTIPVSAVSVAGAVAAGASELTTVGTALVAADAFNVVSSSVSLLLGVKRYFFGGNN